jgi:hypothetical protein
VVFDACRQSRDVVLVGDVEDHRFDTSGAEGLSVAVAAYACQDVEAASDQFRAVAAPVPVEAPVTSSMR